jgi:hypothetical protein
MASLKPGQGLELLKSGLYTDLTLVCNEYQFRIHKAVVCPQSEFFSICVKVSFKEGQESRIELQEAHPRIVAFALLFMYTGDIQATDYVQIWKGEALQAWDYTGPSTTYPLRAMVDIFQIGDRLMLPELQDCVCKQFKDHLRKDYARWLQEDNDSNTERYLGIVLQDLYQVTRSDNTTIRYEATVFALEVILKDKQSYQGLAKVLEEHEPMAWKVVSGAKRIRF